MKFLITMTYGYVGPVSCDGYIGYFHSIIPADRIIETEPENVGNQITDLSKKAHNVLVSDSGFGSGLPKNDKEFLKGLLHIISHSVTQITE